jgi:hypothetical protein
MADIPQAKPECEHYWAYHCYGGLSVRLCQTCHEPDWYELRAQLAEAQREGRVAEREWIAELATRKRAVYCKPCDGAPCAYDDELAPFADLIREQP